jgi:RNA polymerase sigma-70 factor (ECF subfamily)
MSSCPAFCEIDRLARESYGKLLAIVVKRTRDFSASEEALAEALASAIEIWPRTGVPVSPEGWIVAAAYRRSVDRARRSMRQDKVTAELAYLGDELAAMPEEMQIPDERLAMLFMCAHPKIDASARAPLMLQVVLGLTADRIAAAFLVSPQSMAQRLVRAKRSVRGAREIITIPSKAQFRERLDSVLTAVYTAFRAASDEISAEDIADPGDDLATEAIFLARAIVSLLPRQPEALGLLSLLLFSYARRRARKNQRGQFVPFMDQDPREWDLNLIREAERLLLAASDFGTVGRYQLEAAIQSAHTAGRFNGATDWQAIIDLYDRLYKLTRSPVVAVNLCAAIANVRGAEVALKLLDEMAEGPKLHGYQPYWATRAHLLERANHWPEAKFAYQRAIGLAADPSVRNFLLVRCESISRWHGLT